MLNYSLGSNDVISFPLNDIDLSLEQSVNEVASIDSILFSSKLTLVRLIRPLNKLALIDLIEVFLIIISVNTLT